MIDRIDLLIAVIAVAVSAVGSSIVLGMAVSKRADRERLLRSEAKLESGLTEVDHSLATRLTRVETKLDSLISETVPPQLRRSEDWPA